MLTSPEAAAVFLAAEEAVSGAAARGGRRGHVEDPGRRLVADFVPSKATGKVLASELPAPKDNGVVLIRLPRWRPTRSRVAGARYEHKTHRHGTTVPPWDDATSPRQGRQLAFPRRRPSALGERAGTDAAAVCIGETSAAECRRVGFEEVRPDSPGESWADAIAAFYGVRRRRFSHKKFKTLLPAFLHISALADCVTHHFFSEGLHARRAAFHALVALVRLFTQ